MGKEKIYLDTSVPSAYYDYSKPVRQLITQKWFEFEARNYQLYISTLTMIEIEKTENDMRKENIKQLTKNYNCHLLDIDKKTEKLAEEYIKKGAIPPKENEDALHIAIATINSIPLLASWNFKHIVSVNPIRKIHEINKKLNYPIIEIGTLEMYGGAKYGSL